MKNRLNVFAIFCLRLPVIVVFSTKIRFDKNYGTGHIFVFSPEKQFS